MAEEAPAPDFSRIRGNVQKMLGQNAPETDIDAYLSSEGLTADALRAAKPQPNMAADVAKSYGVGLAEGGIGLAGLPGDAVQLGGAAIDQMASKPKLPPAAVPKPQTDLPQSVPEPLIPGSRQLRNIAEQQFGKFYEPQTIPGEYARTTGQMTPNALLPGGPARRLANVLLPAIASETAGQATKGTSSEPYARVGAGVLAMPTIGGRAITPLPASAERGRFVDILRNEGVNSLTAGQVTGNKGLQWFEQAASDMPLGGGGAARMTNQGKEQFTAAALRRVGENANRADDITMSNAFDRIGQQFDDLAARNTAHADQQLLTDVQNTVGNYYNLVEQPNRVPAVTNYAREMFTQLQNNNGVLPGEVYQSLRSRMEATARGTANPEAQRAIRELRGNLDAVMERSIQANNPADLGAWQETRRQYRNIIPLERAATGAGSETAEGFISPSQLRNSVVTQNRRAYARGEGDYAELARAGEAIMKPLPNSGTAPRSLAQSLMTGGVSLGALGLPSVAGRMVTSTSPFLPVQQYLGNQLLAPALHGSTPIRDAAVQLLMSEPRLQLQNQR